MPVDDLARSDVVTADTDTPVAELASTMADEGVGSIVVTDGDEPVGIVTDRDLTVRVLASGDDPDDLVAEDVMSGDLATVDTHAGFYEVADLMSEHGVRRVPVVEDGDLAGIITFDDITELLGDEQQHVADIVRAQRPPY
ncbi:CBS domain-containing protein [Halobacterium sp. R2-5]|uniref:CBS domain-containing protein n=1 Tax=Halobacterium sp. R2-5 TaxID=2715751 RepID=UPI0014225340|nr:CBS domain-containing protein [Halobacterium sp. R2-5]NIB98842.1 CBS domain-containing protein [Halobacterium sp. R2-5]